MPCFDEQGAEDRRLCKERLDRATRVACELWKIVRKQKYVNVSEETMQWILEHEEWDKRREG